MDFPERLRLALDRWPGGSHRTFSKYLKEKGVLGASYRQLARYLSGESEPSLDWIQEACGALDVSADWLVLGKGSIYSADVSSEMIKGQFELLQKVIGEPLKKRGHLWFDAVDQGQLVWFGMRLHAFRPEIFGVVNKKHFWKMPERPPPLDEIPEDQIWSVIDELFPCLREDSPFTETGDADLWGQAHSAFYASLSAAWANEMMRMVGNKKRHDL